MKREFNVTPIRNNTYITKDYYNNYLMSYDRFACSDRFQARFYKQDPKTYKLIENDDFSGFKVRDYKDIETEFPEFYTLAIGLKAIIQDNIILGLNKAHSQFLFKVFRFYITQEYHDWLSLWCKLYKDEKIPIIKAFVLSFYYLIFVSENKESNKNKLTKGIFIINQPLLFSIYIPQTINDFLKTLYNDGRIMRQEWCLRTFIPNKFREIIGNDQKTNTNDINNNSVFPAYTIKRFKSTVEVNTTIKEFEIYFESTKFYKLLKEKKFKKLNRLIKCQKYTEIPEFPSELL